MADSVAGISRLDVGVVEAGDEGDVDGVEEDREGVHQYSVESVHDVLEGVVGDCRPLRLEVKPAKVAGNCLVSTPICHQAGALDMEVTSSPVPQRLLELLA